MAIDGVEPVDVVALGRDHERPVRTDPGIYNRACVHLPADLRRPLLTEGALSTDVGIQPR
jgi:hypothetical protein